MDLNKTATEVRLKMEQAAHAFEPKLWSAEMLQQYEKIIAMAAEIEREAKRPYGEKVLRAAAKGEDWRKIPKPENKK